MPSFPALHSLKHRFGAGHLAVRRRHGLDSRSSTQWLLLSALLGHMCGRSSGTCDRCMNPSLRQRLRVSDTAFARPVCLASMASFWLAVLCACAAFFAGLFTSWLAVGKHLVDLVRPIPCHHKGKPSPAGIFAGRVLGWVLIRLTGANRRQASARPGSCACVIHSCIN